MRTNLSSQITLNRIPERLYRPTDAFELAALTRFEKVPVEIYDDALRGSKKVAAEIVGLMKEKNSKGELFVLGLTGGRAGIELYLELVRLHKEEGLSFKKMAVVNLYEYYPLSKTMDKSFLARIKEMLLDHIDIDPVNIISPDATIDRKDVMAHCKAFEERINALGGIDFQLLGIGRSGNIGFNEPGSQLNSTTRLIMLNSDSRKEAARHLGFSEPPVSSITLGINTIMKAKRIVLLSWGEDKSSVVRTAIEEAASVAFPASFLQLHNNASFVIDIHAAGELTRISKPWLVTSCDWDDKLIRRAIVWLCQQVNKPILKLTDKDYTEHNLSELLTIFGSAYNCNIKIFNDLQHTITGWPGGKPDADDTYRPERAKPYPKKVLVFSPHPDDDVISMGGTLKRLVDQHHEVHVAYETSGNIAVNDDEIIRFLSFVKGYIEMFEPDNKELKARYEAQSCFLVREKGNIPLSEILAMKGLIRRGEAKAACRFEGVSSKNVHFLNLPFYETGTIKKNPISQADIDIVKTLLQELKPHQIYVAGDLADPHGTHKVCLDAVLAAIDDLKDETWLNDCRIWMYRGAWMEWEIDHIEMAVPLSPEELRSKRNAILKHQSQMESAPFLGNDERLFWQRSEERNIATAAFYNQLGLAAYEAIEAFVRYIPIK
ncbi:MAG: glucosamine-6-phosphate deaminase [Bacteroidetes bacterium]|nr:glucosamine-6-phosphate deaminase [Bacteroidota bacterium]